MKKIIFFFISVVCSCFAFGQQKIYFTENFSTTSLSNWDKDNSTDLLYFAKSNQAGGSSQEMVIGYDPSSGLSDPVVGTIRLISKAFSTVGYTNNYVSFKQFYVASATSTTKNFGVAVRKSASSEWTVIYESNTKGNLPVQINPGTISAKLPDQFNNQTDVQMCMFFTSTKDNVNFLWFFDDIAFFSAGTVNYASISLEDKEYTDASALVLGAKITNLGLPITSCKVSYTLDENSASVVSPTIEPNPLLPNISSPFSVAVEGWDALKVGSHTIKIWASEINGTAVENANKKVYTKKIYKADTSIAVPRQALMEIFTSATCGYCPMMNQTLDPLFEEYSGKFSLIKYQMNFPGSGDVYYTEEGGVRRSYYGASSVPSVVGNGTLLEFANETTYTQIKDSVERIIAPSAKEKAYFSFQFDTVGIDVNGILHLSYKVKSKVDASTYLHTVVVEKETTKNKSSNGESVFHNVMMKMIPNAEGRVVSYMADSTYTYNLTCDMSKTHIESVADLKVICFLQDKNHTILQSGEASVVRYGNEMAAKISNVVTMPYIAQPKVPVMATLVNQGGAATSMEISASIDAGVVSTLSLSNINVDWTKSYTFVFPSLSVATEGVHNLEIWVSKVNGVDNAAIIKNKISFTSKFNDVPFRPMVEELTSSSCEDCAILNKDIINPAYEKAPSAFSLAKYPMKGDPYYQLANERYMNYYKVQEVPTVLVNGRVIPVGISDTTANKNLFSDLIASFTDVKSIIKIEAENVSFGLGKKNSVHADINLTSAVGGRFYVYATLVEKKTTKNTGSNGETQMINTVQSIMPTYMGIVKSLVAGTPTTYLLEMTPAVLKIENPKNLALIIYVQDATHSNVLQSITVDVKDRTANEENAPLSQNWKMYPNPATDMVTIEDLKEATVELYDMVGRCLWRGVKVSGNYELNLQKYSAGNYLVKVIEQGQAYTSKLVITK